MKTKNQFPLEKMITETTTSFLVEVENWEEAVLFAGELLVKSGFVEERYCLAMVDMIKDLGPYAVITPGVALPHARPEDGIIVPCMSLITLKTPVDFGSEANDPVKLVIAFAITDHNSHIAALSQLARVLEDAEKLEALKSAIDFLTVVKVFEDIR